MKRLNVWDLIVCPLLRYCVLYSECPLLEALLSVVRRLHEEKGEDLFCFVIQL